MLIMCGCALAHPSDQVLTRITEVFQLQLPVEVNPLVFNPRPDQALAL